MNKECTYYFSDESGEIYTSTVNGLLPFDIVKQNIIDDCNPTGELTYLDKEELSC